MTACQIRRCTIFFYMLLVSILPANALAADEEAVDKLVENIITVRGEVEDLENQLKQRKDEHAGRMSSLAREEGQLSAERERQELRLKKMQQQLLRQQENIGEIDSTSESVRPILVGAIASVRTYVESSLPFKKADRLAALDELEVNLETGVLEPSRAANQLWTFMADEIRLTGEVGLYRQPITVDGKNKLADVARVGMMNLYFRTEDDQVGYWVPEQKDDGFRYVDGASRAAILELMSSLRKNVRVGYFALPTPSGLETN